MTREEFWDHIKASKRKDPEAHVERLTARLAKLPPDEILDFDHWWNMASAEAYRWNLWGAAYLLNGGCSDDGFEYFRDWLILQGKDVYQAAVENPDSLADVVDAEQDEYECECYPGSRAWFQSRKAEGHDDDDDYAVLNAARLARHPERPVQRDEDMGENWDFDDDAEVRRRLPRLARMYLEGGRASDGDDH